MNIVFLCSCLEPGRDGVGDYTRRLAIELILQGHNAAGIAVNDNFISKDQGYYQSTENTSFKLLRISSQCSIKDRFGRIKKYIDEFNPNYISLQFVIYGFHPKGLSFMLGRHLASIGVNKRWHIMFHEIWPGITKKSPLKHKLYGFFQKNIIKNILKNITPHSITTSNRLYQLILAEQNIKSTILPLFSNIKLATNHEDIIKDIVFQNELKLSDDQLILGIFGTLYPNVNLEELIKKQLVQAQVSGKKLVFISFGRTGENGLKELNRLKEVFYNKVQFIILPEQPEDKVSALLQLMTVGISCTPIEHLGKSGVFAAMRLHNLQVLTPVSDNIPEYEDELKIYNEHLFKREPYKWGVEYGAKSFIRLLEKDLNAFTKNY